MRVTSLSVWLLCVGLQCLAQQNETQIRLSIRADPKTFDPLLAMDDTSEPFRYITGGVLVRFNRSTHQMEPELAESWTVSNDGRRIDFVLRKGLRFSDGTPFDAADVAAQVKRVNDPAIRSGIADMFRSEKGAINVEVKGPDRVALIFPSPIAGALRLFDQLVIQSSRSRQPERAFLGPYMLADYKPGQFVLLRRNPQYWKKDKQGQRLPYTDTVRLDILASRDVELARFRDGELDVIDKVEPDVFERLQ